MEKATELGSNKTGMDMSPLQSKNMTDTEELSPVDQSDRSALTTMRREYLEISEPLGSVPVPGTVKGALKSTMKKFTGRNPEVFINKLGERLAFERTGVRIYEQLILKCSHAAENGTSPVDIPLERLQEFCNQEAEHFALLKECVEELGADPTAQTPDADASAVASLGLLKVVVDPRTSISQTLEAMLSLELTDNAAWELLIQLADDMSLSHMSERFDHALHQEEIHLVQVREWYEQSVRMQGSLGASKH